MTEIEFKYGLSAEQYRLIIGKFSWDKETIIENYYYDSPNYILHTNNITLRVRRINGNFIVMESKRNNDKSITSKRTSQEYSISIDAIPSQINIETARNFTGIAANDISLFGKLTTLRKTKTLGIVEISVDQCEYLGKTDYELELEVNSDVDSLDVSELIGISDLKPSEGKRSRLIKEIRGENCDGILI